MAGGVEIDVRSDELFLEESDDASARVFGLGFVRELGTNAGDVAIIGHAEVFEL